MLTFRLSECEPRPESVLVMGAHSDDIEVGCGGTLLRLMACAPPKAVTWVVFSADQRREGEARSSAEAILRDVAHPEIVVKRFRDGLFPGQITELKECFENLKAEVSPDLILTHYRGDLHQDHRVVSELTWQTFRHHTILEYEVPKYDGDFGTPNVFVPLDEHECQLKVQHLLEQFPSQQHRRWFSRDVFMAVLRLRGLEAAAPSGYAEAFYARKILLG